MLRQLGCRRELLRRALAVVPGSLVEESLGHELSQQRGMRLFEIFSKEERAKRQAALKEEMQRGYFDDFRDFRDTQGKVWQAPDRLVPASQAPRFPELHALRPDGSVATFPPVGGGGGGDGGGAALVCVAFRAGAQEMVDAWAAPFAEHFRGRPGFSLLELALIESRVMSLWPFKGMLLKGGEASEQRHALPSMSLFHFGETDDLRKALHMTNRLTGYAYLVDGKGRVRWRGSGKPTERELGLLVHCAEELAQAPGG